MIGIQGLIVGLAVATVVIFASCFVMLIAVIENLKDLKAWHWTVMGRLDGLRDGQLRILKALKGESYQGSFGGMDIHTSPNIPPGGGLMFNSGAFVRLTDPEETAHA